MNWPAHQHAVAPPRPQVDPTNPGSVAADVLARISAYDSTAPRADDDVVRRWAEIIQVANIDYQFIIQGIVKVYSSGGEPPKMKLTAVLDAAREVRRDTRKGDAVRELGPAPSFDDDAIAPGDAGYAVETAYQTNGVIGLRCEQCGARPDEVCERDGKILKIPHTPRLALAYRTNHPLGRKRHLARQQHLAEHRKTYQPTWKTDSRSR